jgi:hypothetical protein
LSSVSNLFNSGTILANSSGAPLTLDGRWVFNQTNGTIGASNGRLAVMGAVTNRGTFNFLNSVGTFNSTVVNSGQWIMDPSTNVFQNTMTVTAAGMLSMTAGDVMIFTNGASSAASFINLSTNNTAFNTLDGKFLFENTLGATQDFVVAGHDVGPFPTSPILSATNQILDPLSPTFYGFSNNFALGTLEISAFSTVRVSDAFMGISGWGTNDNLMAGLYLNNLILGQNSLLIISTNVQVYFINSNNWNTANFLLEGNPTFNNTFNGLHQLTSVPEPNVLMLLVAGGVAIAARRRRGRSLLGRDA